MGDPVTVLCVTCAELPAPYVRSRRCACEVCGAAVWMDAELRRRLAGESGREPLAVCVGCGSRLAGEALASGCEL